MLRNHSTTFDLSILNDALPNESTLNLTVDHGSPLKRPEATSQTSSPRRCRDLPRRQPLSSTIVLDESGNLKLVTKSLLMPGSGLSPSKRQRLAIRRQKSSTVTKGNHSNPLKLDMEPVPAKDSEITTDNPESEASLIRSDSQNFDDELSLQFQRLAVVHKPADP
jgi:hypothetical protein